MSDGGLRYTFTSDQINSTRFMRANNTSSSDVTEAEDIEITDNSDTHPTFECPITYENETDPCIIIIKPPKSLLVGMEKKFTNLLIDNPLNAFLNLDFIDQIVEFIDHPISLKSVRMSYDFKKPMEFSPITRKPILGFVPLGSHPSHVKSANWTLSNLFTGGKLLGNSDFWFALFYFIIVRGKVPYLTDEITPFVTQHMLFRLKNTVSSASLTGLSGYVQSKIRLDAAIYFSLSSSLFLPPPEPSYDTLRLHLLHIEEFLCLAELAKLKIPNIIFKHIRRTKLALELLNMSKKPNGKKILLSIQRALYQNSIIINKDNINPELLVMTNNVYKYSQFTLPFVPIDGPANENSINFAVSLLPSSAKIFPVNELYELIESLM
jgi:hypothetical protein